MKRIISIILSAAILLSCCFMFSGCVDRFPSIEMKQRYAKQFDIEGVKTSEVLLEYYSGTYNGYTVVMLDASCHDFDEWQEKIGDNVINYPDTNRLLAYKGGKFITLTEAYASGALTDADIAEIANKFNAEITVFYQVCDEFDFLEECQYYIPSLEDDFSTEYVFVAMDKKFSAENKVPPESYFGTDIVKSVIDCTPGVSNPLSENYRKLFFLYLHENSKENVIYVINRLKTIPGISYIEINDLSAVPDVTFSNDEYYDSGNQWGLSFINIENVWDFTTGSESINVGIIDSGIASHPDLIGNINYSLGYDFANSEQVTSDDTHGHGTIVHQRQLHFT